MHQKISRKSFFQLAGTALAGLALESSPTARALEPFNRQGSARLRLSLAAYSFRQYFQAANPQRNTPPPGGRKRDLTMAGFIDYCAQQGCDGAELTSYYLPQDISRPQLLELRRHAFLKGISVSGTAVGNTFTHPSGPAREAEISHVKTWIDRAAVLGAPHIRVFAGNIQKGSSLKEAQRFCIDTLQQCADHAAQAGIFLGLENHGGIVAEADSILEIIRQVQSPWVGINLDTGNFHTDDPYADLERCAPYAVNVQVKVEIKPRNQPAGPADLKRILDILRSAHYQGFVALEYESAPDPWVAVPKHLDQLRELL